uniref:PNPLA domain-containing protein n=1 Tax=viral metagenome TaxID=1070528 RepID=A0A6C0DQQ5_9ZZZZ
MTENITHSQQKPTIKHLVISGGGINGFSFYGALRETARQQVWKMEDIETMHGTSIGTVLAVMLALKYEWETLDDYLIKRPWHHVYKFDMYSIFDSFQKRGIFTKKVIEETFLPLFNGKDMSIDITMKEFYDKTGVEIHIFTTELNTFKLIDISYKTHPEWRVVDAVYCSSALPIVMAPILKGECWYCDGGLLCNYPILKCLENGANIEEVLGITRIPDTSRPQHLSGESTILDFAMIVLSRILENVLATPPVLTMETEFRIPSFATSIYEIYSVCNDMQMRMNLIEKGVSHVKKQLDKALSVLEELDTEISE